MNLSEFKAWFEGYTENMDGPPGEKQWKRIQARVAEITDAPSVSYPIFIERYVKPYCPPYITWTSARLDAQGIYYTSGDSYVGKISSNGTAFNSQDAFRELGRQEAMN